MGLPDSIASFTADSLNSDGYCFTSRDIISCFLDLELPQVNCPLYCSHIILTFRCYRHRTRQSFCTRQIKEILLNIGITHTLKNLRTTLIRYRVARAFIKITPSKHKTVITKNYLEFPEGSIMHRDGDVFVKIQEHHSFLLESLTKI
jgi:hypothetical protein